MKLTVSYDNGMFNVDCEKPDHPDGFTFSLIEGMYKNGYGYGCQVNQEELRDNIEKLCFDLYNSMITLNNKYKQFKAEVYPTHSPRILVAHGLGIDLSDPNLLPGEVVIRLSDRDKYSYSIPGRDFSTLNQCVLVRRDKATMQLASLDEPVEIIITVKEKSNINHIYPIDLENKVIIPKGIDRLITKE